MIKSLNLIIIVVFYGSWYDYELGMEEASVQYPGMIYTCYYEDFKRVS